MKKHPIKCPKCGCMVHDPFTGTIVIHDIAKCTGFAVVRK